MGEPIPKHLKVFLEDLMVFLEGGMILKRSQDHNQKKTYQCQDSVTVLVMVCEKMEERVEVARQEEDTGGT
jgi:hypothetical protein